MKKLLLLFITGLVASPLFAQKFEVGVNGGLNAYSGFKDNDFYLNNDIDNTSIYATGNVSIAYTYKQWKGGLAANFDQIGYYSPAWDEWNLFGGIRFFVPTRLFINRTFAKGNFQPYAGLSAGTILNPSKQFDVIRPIKAGHKGDFVTGFCGGFQFGYTSFFSKHFGINQELSVNYLNISSGYKTATQLLAFALTLGVRYRI